RQPAIWDRGQRDPAHDRRAARLPALGGDGPAGGGGAAGGAARDAGVRGPVGAGPAGLRRAGAASDLAHRLLPGAQRRLGAGRAGVNPLRTLAPGKVNLCLALGEERADGRHELVTVVQAISLADQLRLETGVGADEVICPAVHGENLAAHALTAYREAAGWSG